MLMYQIGAFRSSSNLLIFIKQSSWGMSVQEQFSFTIALVTITATLTRKCYFNSTQI